jgi:hypothetical protein
MNKIGCWSLAFAALACGSCGHEGNGLYPVWGEVTCNGSGAAGATVYFHRQGADPNAEQMMMGIVQDDGSFELVCGSLGAGAPPGEYDVLIEWKEVLGHSQGRPQRGPDKLEGRFADPSHPRLHAIIKPEPNDLAPFDVTEPD